MNRCPLFPTVRGGNIVDATLLLAPIVSATIRLETIFFLSTVCVIRRLQSIDVKQLVTKFNRSVFFLTLTDLSDTSESKLFIRSLLEVDDREYLVTFVKALGEVKSVENSTSASYSCSLQYHVSDGCSRFNCVTVIIWPP